MTINEALSAADHSVIEMGIPAMKTSSETSKRRERVFVLLGSFQGKLIKTEEIEIRSQQETEPWSGHGHTKHLSNCFPPLSFPPKKEEPQQQQQQQHEL